MRDLGNSVEDAEVQRRYFAVAKSLDEMAERTEIDDYLLKLAESAG